MGYGVPLGQAAVNAVRAHRPSRRAPLLPWHYDPVNGVRVLLHDL